MHFIFRHARKVVVAVIGVTIVLLGVLVIPIPGPGPAPILILGGLALLATEFVWAAILLKHARAMAEKTADRMANVMPGNGPPASDQNPSRMRRLIRKIPVPAFVGADGASTTEVGASDESGKLPDMGDLIITLDGPAGSGKSSVASGLARRLGLEFLDTGAMYRGVTVACMAIGIDPATQRDAAIELARKLRIDFDWKSSPPRLIVEIPGRPQPVDLAPDRLADLLRDPVVTRAVSHIAKLSEVRHVLVDAQRRIGEQHRRIVTEGRDQGSVVFPQARVKFYLTARPEVRARRRCEEMRQAKKPVDEAQVLNDILLRDRLDRERSDGPLIRPADAIEVDTSDMSREQVIVHLETTVKSAIAKSNGEAGAAVVAGGASPGSSR